MISKQTIDKIFSAVRVEEIIGEYVQLKRAGSNYKGLSPFHDEKSPSFVVSPSKQIWKDFSSGKGGTAISFLMEIENFTYPEALKHAAKKYGIEIEEDLRELTEAQKQAQTDKELLYKIHEIANDFFQDQLFETEEGKTIAYSYFKERELRDDIIKKFQLGYSPEQRNAFTEFALNKGYSKEILEKSGLSIFPENAPNGIDRFRERVLFPIHSFSGRVLGFGARILKNNIKTAKYLNSPETEIYHKSSVLYGLSQGKQAISKNNLCLLVEGYMDVIALHQSGIENVVASSGTALTVDQIKLIKRLTENVTILFDGDPAGIKASFRSIDLLLAEEMNIRILLFPDGDDPDSFSRKHPQHYVEDFIKTQAKDFIDFKAEILLKEAGDDPIKKAESIRDIVKSVAFVKNALKQEVYLKEVATKFGLSEQSLFNELNVQKQIQNKQFSPQQRPEPQERPKMEIVPPTSISVNPLLELEEKLVKHMLNFGDRVLEKSDADNQPFKITVIEEIISHFNEDNYEAQSPINKKIIEELKNGLANNEIIQSNFFLTLMDETIVSKVSNAILEDDDLSDWEKSNIFPPKPGDKLEAEIEDDILIHKSHFIEKLIYDIVKKLDSVRDENPEEYYESVKRIMILKNLLNEINLKLNRQLTKGHSFFREQKL
ncbi:MULTISPECIES: DNA primase [unclassified Kaistella]|uniref:DNA primase n=1 Tax=unclassified Kaistella TaxID=2762626 RepID=UPI0027322BEF|nr:MULTISPECIES: DNA primase [unclassified Kaistella]MCZ2084175.1 DNA primase [Flavobacteriales bacterium]MDP2454053.1 DNA primase [Kaistella sp. SH11-4b]MDP2457110.1 DNA primase [Kaistella sp. SH40-3]MDP2459868.1 DNA primase [Kaistella sp. SH19-2b]